MDHLASISAAPTTQRAQNVQAKPPIAPWIFTAAFAAIAGAVLLADAALAPEQLVDAFFQAGMAP